MPTSGDRPRLAWTRDEGLGHWNVGHRQVDRLAGAGRAWTPRRGYRHRRVEPLGHAAGSTDWVWREDAITELLADHRQGTLFVAGCKSNQGTFYAQFDHVALLSAPADVLLARIAARNNNPYGKKPEDRDLILQHLAEIEPRPRATATIEIDASAPIFQVVDQLEELRSSVP